MPRTPKSSNRSQRWSMPSFFSSGFSNKRTSTTTTRTTRPRHANPQQTKCLVEAKKETPTSAAKATRKEEEAGPWMMLYDRNGRQFLWNKSTGQWTYDGIALYAPPGPATNALAYPYGYYGPHQQHQQQQQQQIYSYAQPSVGYYAPAPYTASPSPCATAHQQPWQSPPPMTATVPWIIPAAPQGAAPVFF